MPPTPSVLRRHGPYVVLGCLLSWAVAYAAGAPEPSTAMLGWSLLGAALLFPPWRHPSRARYDGTIWSVKLGLVLIAAGFMGQVLGTIAVGFVVGLKAGLAGKAVSQSPEFSASMLFAATLSTAAAAFIALMILRLRGYEWWAVGLQPQGFWSALWVGAQSGLVLAGFKLMYFKMLQTLGVWQLEGSGPVQVMFALDEPRYLVGGLLMGAVVVPIAEEILFRGVLFAALRRHAGPFAAAITSSALFGLLHDEHVFPTILGLVFSLLYHRTGSLWTSIGAHVLVNSVTLGLCFAHGALIERVTWTMVGGGIVVVALAQLAAIWFSPSTPPAACACGRPGPADAVRCAQCCYPLDVWPIWATGTLRFLSAVLLVGLGASAFSAGWWITRPYDRLRGPKWLALQYNLLKGGNNPLAEKLLADWAADDPKSEDVRMFRLSEAYRTEDYPAIVKLTEARYEGKPDRWTASDLNMLSLACTEMGGEHLKRAVEAGIQAVEKADVHARPHYEDTLGWAYVRAGQLEDARPYLDRDPEVYGQTSKGGMAELVYHRGVLVWALGETERARGYFELAARMGEDGRPFSTRSATILAERRLPPGLVPPTPIEVER